MENRHVRDELHDLVDGRLDPAERARVEAHLEECSECRREREAIARVKQAAASALASREAPEELAASATALLDREDRERPARAEALGQPRPRRVAIFASVAAAIAALIALTVFFAKPRDVPTRVAEDYSKYRAGRLALEIETSDPAELEKFFAGRAVAFPTRVLDLGMMGYRLVGGRVLTDGALSRVFFVYRGEGNKILACQMYEGDVRDLSGAPELRRHGDFAFFVYRIAGQTQVFWQEGPVVCVLTSDIPGEEVVQLAFAKAMKV